MDIRLTKESEVPLRQQLAEQIVFLITTGKLRPGQRLPSVREVARRLKIHHNTVSAAYQELVRRTWVVRQRGSRLVVGSGENSGGDSSAGDLDEFINASVRRARELGYSLQALRQRVRERLAAQPPDHILVVEEDPGLREIMQRELQEALGWPVAICSREDLARSPELLIGAQLATPQYALDGIEALAPKHRPPVPISFSGADEHLELLRKLREPSIIGIASISEALLKTARSLLAPAVGRRHTLKEFLLARRIKTDLRAVDVVFCDSVSINLVRNRRPIRYALVEPKSREYLAATIRSLDDNQK